MSTAQADVSTILLDRVADWLTQSSLAGTDLEAMVTGFCERLAAAGLPLARVHLTFSMLHPLYTALGFTWQRGEGVRIERFITKRGQHADRFLRSPYYHLLSHDLDHLRRRLDYSSTASEFPIFDDLREKGVTDYMAFVHAFDGNSSQGMMGSWATDSAEGFSDSMIAALLRMQNHLAVAAKMAVLGRLAGNMLTTYLGEDAGQRVLSGQIRRGDGETIRAALVMADMRGSTKLAETEGRQVYIDTLNEFFDAIAAPFNRDGGQILSFLGDGFLAVYPCDRHKEPTAVACRAAFSAALKATKRVSDLNAERRSRQLTEIGYGIGLHIGNVMFGNVGLKDRLTFSAFGAAVNEVQRLQGLTKRYSNQVIASEAFATYCGGSWITLGEEAVGGTGEKMTVLSPELGKILPVEDDAVAELPYDSLSDAEQVILLHRDSRKAELDTKAKKLLQ